MIRTIPRLLYLLLCIAPCLALAADSTLNLHITDSIEGPIALLVFFLAYLLVMAEEFIHLRKSKPVILAAGIIWILIGWESHSRGITQPVADAVRHNLLEYVELFLFLLVAMTYVNSLEERNLFAALRVWLVRKGFSFRQLYLITGILTFLISPIADNLTAALLMGAVVCAVGGDNIRFVSLSCINIILAANAGGAFSPFGDITTLMIWQKGMVQIHQFLNIFVPSVVSYIIPAGIIYFSVPKVFPEPNRETVDIKHGAYIIAFLFLATIATTVIMNTFLHLPPAIGMMTGLGYLQFFAFYLKKREIMIGVVYNPYDIFNRVKLAEWDTLLFFYGVILCVGGLATFGYLELASNIMYTDWGSNLQASHQATPANILVGFFSAIVDNIPIVYAVLTMNPSMSLGQWLLVTLTAGVGGSMLSIGSAAGVALMGQARGKYTFFCHLRWTWAIVLGYLAAVACHIWINAHLF